MASTWIQTVDHTEGERPYLAGERPNIDFWRGFPLPDMPIGKMWVCYVNADQAVIDRLISDGDIAEIPPGVVQNLADTEAPKVTTSDVIASFAPEEL